MDKTGRTQATEATRTTVGYIELDKFVDDFEFVNRALRMGRPVSLNFSSCRWKSRGGAQRVEHDGGSRERK